MRGSGTLGSPNNLGTSEDEQFSPFSLAHSWRVRLHPLLAFLEAEHIRDDGLQVLRLPRPEKSGNRRQPMGRDNPLDLPDRAGLDLFQLAFLIAVRRLPDLLGQGYHPGRFSYRKRRSLTRPMRWRFFIGLRRRYSLSGIGGGKGEALTAIDVM